MADLQELEVKAPQSQPKIDKIWVIIPVITTIIFGSIAAWQTMQNYGLQKQVVESSLPYINVIALQAQSNYEGAYFPFYVINPSNRQEYTLNLSQGGCTFETNLIRQLPPQSTNSTINSTKNGIQGVGINPQIAPQTIPLSPRNITELYCEFYKINQTAVNINTNMTACVGILGFNKPICSKIPLLIHAS